MRIQAYKLPILRRDGSVKAYALVSPQDAWARQYRWNFVGKGYLCRRLPMVNGVPGKTIYLHREILGLTVGDGLEGDHKNRNKLDCRQGNLRVVTPAQNNQNLSSHAGSTSRYRNVSWSTFYDKWIVQVQVAGRKHFVGRFDDEDEAGAAAQAFRLAHMSHATD